MEGAQLRRRPMLMIALVASGRSRAWLSAAVSATLLSLFVLSVLYRPAAGTPTTAQRQEGRSGI